MTKCPICKTEIEENQDYCKNCAWEFEYYFDELSEEERKRYDDRLKIYQTIYNRSLLEPKTIDINIIQEPIVEIDGLMYQSQPFIKKYTWEEAKEYAKNLRLGGFDDWRLPTRAELEILITEKSSKNLKEEAHFIDARFIENMPKYSWFWSSEERDFSYAWGICFSDDIHNVYTLKFDNKYALCVRSI